MRVKGTGVAHTGDVVPLEGIKGPGSANTYFDGYAYEKHVGVPVTPKAKNMGAFGFCMFPSSIYSTVSGNLKHYSDVDWSRMCRVIRMSGSRVPTYRNEGIIT